MDCFNILTSNSKTRTDSPYPDILLNSLTKGRNNYLSTIEWKKINTILNHNESSPELHKKVNNIIYNYYEKWAFSTAYSIKKKYWKECRLIQYDELKLYAYIGLRKSIMNYDSNKINIFTDYAIKYIYDEVYNSIYPRYLFHENYKNILKNHHKIHKHKHYGKTYRKPSGKSCEKPNNKTSRLRQK
jgi:hypothetical protein